MIIDGNYENIGGGQILRTALAMSLITDMPFKIINIRKSRHKPGLKPQHVACLNAIKQLFDVNISEYDVGTTELVFMKKSNKLKTKNLTIDIGTAGSITLLLQSILMPLMFSTAKNIKLKLVGGTDVPYSMPYDFFNSVFLPHIQKYCTKLEFNLIKRGFYPKGDGEIELKIQPKFINDKDNFIDFQKYLISQNLSLNYLEKGHIQSINGISLASKDLFNRDVSIRQERSARLLLKDYAKTNINIEYSDAVSTGSFVVLYARYSIDNYDIDKKNPVILGSDALGKIDLKAEEVGKISANNLIKLIKSDACVDANTCDNLIPFIAIFGGKLKTYEITDHIKTNIYTVNLFLKAINAENYIKVDFINRIISLENISETN